MIKVENVTKSFGDNKVLQGITCQFEENKIASIIAPNGAGKTTLMSIISGLLIPDTGKVEFTDGCGREDISVVFAGEKNLYMKNTVLENLIYFGTIQGMTKKEIMERIKEYEQYLPFIGEVCNKLAERLSYGQKRLVTIFSAIITNAKCIIIDEASEGLDMSYIQILKKMLIKTAKKRILIITSHDYNFIAKISDKILFLKEGQIFEELSQLSSEELQNRYIEIFNLELEE